MNTTSLDCLIQQLVAFRDARDWKQFHNPKDLAAALSIEAAELQELFLWQHPDNLDLDSPAKKERIEEEVADVASFLLLLCNELEIDLADAVQRKIGKNADKHPPPATRFLRVRLDSKTLKLLTSSACTAYL